MAEEFEDSTMASLMAMEKAKKEVSNDSTVVPSHRSTKAPVKKLSLEDERVETIRKAIKRRNNEAANYRFTPEEKESLGDILYELKKRGIRSSENEIIRIAVNYMIEDYQVNGDKSTLVAVLESLNA
jgi:hypothetical protein